MKIYKYIPFICFFTLLFSCKVGQKYQQPEMKNMPEAFESGATSDTISVYDIGWSSLYKDSVLQYLIDKALENNKDILIATARIKEMKANKRISFADMFPEIGVNVLAEREQENYGGDNKSLLTELHAIGTIGWEVDIWGKLRWANDAAIAAYMQTVEARKALKLTIIAEVSQAYFELISLDQRLNLVKQTLASRRQAVVYTRLRFEGGLTSEMPYRQGLLELARAETLIPTLENEIKVKENDLTLLIGEFPSNVDIPRGLDIINQYIPDGLPVDLPSSLLRRRPDILQAEQRLIERNAGANIAFANIFPSINLTGNFGFENSELSQFLKSPTWLISGLLTGPIFNMGKNKAVHEVTKAVYEQEVYNYEKTVMNVFREVNDAIITFEKSREVLKSYEKLYHSAYTYHELAKLQYINGITSNLEVLDSQRRLFEAEMDLNSATLNELISLVSLYKAMGGGLHK